MIRKLVFIFLFLAGHAMAENAAFDPKTNVLTLPSVQVDTKVYSTTQVALPVDGKWSLIGMGAESPAVTADTAVFDVNSNVLTVPSLRIGSQLYSPTQVVLPADGQWATLRVGTVSAAPASTLAVTPNSITGATGNAVKLNISGGSPPYVVSSSDFDVASVGSVHNVSKTYYSVSPTSLAPQAVATIIIGNMGTAQTWVTDAVGDAIAIPVTSTGITNTLETVCVTPSGDPSKPTLAYAPLSISPTSIVARTSELLTLFIGGGAPPYSVVSSRNVIAGVSPVSISANPCHASVTVSTLTVGTVNIVATDTRGALASTTITVTEGTFAISPTTASVRAGAPIKISIVGGRPPYQVSSSYNFVAHPDKGTYESSSPNVEATIRTRSPGTATITVSEADGHQATVAVTVTP